MPCYDPRDKNDLIEEKDSDSSAVVDKMLELMDTIDKRNAMLCAIFNELKRRGIYIEIIEYAEMRGNIKIFDFAKEHLISDIKRLKKEGVSHKSSKDEIELMELIKKGVYDEFIN